VRWRFRERRPAADPDFPSSEQHFLPDLYLYLHPSATDARLASATELTITCHESLDRRLERDDICGKFAGRDAGSHGSAKRGRDVRRGARGLHTAHTRQTLAHFLEPG
jgi:hypothetical protein